MKTPTLIVILCAGLTAGFLGRASAQDLTLGSTAPSFRLNDHKGKAQSFPPKNRWSVLAFYPRAMTGG